MTYEEFNQICQSLPQTTYVMQWGESHVWKVAGKVFAVGGWGPDKQPAFTFKTSEQNFVFLSESEGFRPAPYFANRGMKWIQAYTDKPSDDDDIKYYLQESHRLVAMGLSGVKRKSLGLYQD